ncbi:MAG: ASCH domain-containing protein [Actinobacteria bacterium]|nr:ASCH domain-containing protein [Actinomycetota bacterium]
MFPIVDGLRSIEFGTPGPSRETLVSLVLHGRKRATAGLLREYEVEGEPIEHVGELLAMVDNAGVHVGTLRVTRVEILRFADVDDEFALAEAEGDLDATDFRASHLAYWSALGESVDDDTLLVTLYFDLLPEIIRRSGE